uniref:Uncharacterized protein n=1 Tax=Sexangularia sp. CB-2014 TaxID=1486929 RepID=A0A7S1VF06_9EUKA
MQSALYSYYCGIMTFGKGWKRLWRLVGEKERGGEHGPGALRRLLALNTVASLPLFAPSFLPESVPTTPFLAVYLVVLWYQTKWMKKMVAWLEARRARGQQHRPHQPPATTLTRQPLSAKVSTAAYSALLYLLLGLQTTVIPTLLPAPLPPLVTALLTAWLYAFYAYDATWSSLSYPLARKMTVFEREYIFFAGFGTPFAVTVCVTSLHAVTAYALASLLYPVSLCASFGSPLGDGLLRGRFGAVPLFAVPKRILGMVGRAAVADGRVSARPTT